MCNPVCNGLHRARGPRQQAAKRQLLTCHAQRLLRGRHELLQHVDRRVGNTGDVVHPPRDTPRQLDLLARFLQRLECLEQARPAM